MSLDKLSSLARIVVISMKSEKITGGYYVLHRMTAEAQFVCVLGDLPHPKVS